MSKIDIAVWSKHDEAVWKRNQSWREDLSQGARDSMDWLGDALPTNKIEDRTVKGYPYGGYSSYFTSNDLREIANHFIEVANWLDAQADAYNPLDACDDE